MERLKSEVKPHMEYSVRLDQIEARKTLICNMSAFWKTY